MNYISNAFSLQMITLPATVNVVEVAPSEVPTDSVSCIGHTDTAAVVSDILGFTVPTNRVSIKLNPYYDVLYVAQLSGGRLPEGATTLPENFTLKFLKVTTEKYLDGLIGEIFE